MNYPVHAARLVKLGADCAGFRFDVPSNRERNNWAVISNWSNSSECGNSERIGRFPESCELRAESFFPET
jgi:hypothetical protein